ncbi:MAG: ABC transporter permease [Candidatus Ratteibacteria bacterium]|jgi:ABC-type transport system involved in multi-copper enzyme maturation permease subunit
MKSLFWKELRENRLLLFLSAAIVLMVYIFSVVIKMRWFDFEMATGTAYVFLVLFALIFGVSTFSGELERDNLNFLISLPITRNRIFWTKFLAGFACLVFLSLFFLLVAFLFSFVSPVKRFLFQPGTSLFSGLLMIYVSIACYLYSIGFLLAALRVRTLPGVISGFLLAGFLYLVINPLSDILFGYSNPVGNFFNIQATIFHIFLSAAIALFFAYYFWTRYVTRGMSSFRSTIRTSITFLLFLGLLYAGLNLFYARQITAEIERIKISGRPTTPIEAAPKPVPDRENAALIYEEAFKLLEGKGTDRHNKYSEKERELSNAFKGLDYSNFFQWKIEDKQRIFQIAGENKPAYLFIKKATQVPACRFPLDYTAGNNMEFPYHTPIRLLRGILIARTITEAEQGNYNAAVDDLLSGVQMAEHLSTEPDTMSFSFYNGTINTFLKILQGIYDRTDLNQPQLIRIAKKLDSIPGRESAVHAATGERACFPMSAFRMLISPRANETFWGAAPPYYAGPVLFFYRTLGNLNHKHDYIVFLRLSEQQLNLLEKPYYQTKDVFRGFERNLKRLSRYAPFTVMFDRYYGQAFSLPIANLEALQDLAKIVTALKRYKLTHGQYPKDLAELRPDFISELPIDPFTGRDFIYKQEGKGFILYSLGENGVDNGGKIIIRRFVGDSGELSDDIPWRQNH